jgi:hypothetical protein
MCGGWAPETDKQDMIVQTSCGHLQDCQFPIRQSMSIVAWRILMGQFCSTACHPAPLHIFALGIFCQFAEVLGQQIQQLLLSVA